MREVCGFSHVTRFEVIDHTVRAFVRYGCEVSVQVQDDGRTLKIFVNDRDVEPLF